MSEDASVQLFRAGSQVAGTSTFQIQLDKLSPREEAFYSGADPHFTYDAFTTGLPTSDPFLVRLDDHLNDQVIIDPLTSVKRVFRIISDPEPFPIDGHWEMVVVRYRGT